MVVMSNHVTRRVGFCQICEGEFKLHGELMVHHGFKRPGDGYIHGDCFGVNELPYERSCELVKDYVSALRTRREAVGNELRQLKAGTVTHFVTTRRTTWGPPVLLTRSVFVTDPYVWSTELEQRVSRVEAEIRNLEFDIRRCDKRIAVWRLVPIREIDEAKVDAEKRAEQTARVQVRDDKRAAVKAKREALDHARALREAARMGLLAGFAWQFKAIAAETDESPTDEQKARARAVAEEASKKKHQRFGYWYPSDLDCDRALVGLGLGSEMGGNRGNGRPCVSYFFNPNY